MNPNRAFKLLSDEPKRPPRQRITAGIERAYTFISLGLGVIIAILYAIWCLLTWSLSIWGVLIILCVSVWLLFAYRERQDRWTSRVDVKAREIEVRQGPEQITLNFNEIASVSLSSSTYQIDVGQFTPRMEEARDYLIEVMTRRSERETLCTMSNRDKARRAAERVAKTVGVELTAHI